MEASEVTIVVEPPEQVVVAVEKTVVLPVVEVEIAGVQGPSAADKPLDVDPVEIYLKARGEMKNGNHT